MKIALLIDTWFPFVGGGQINAFEISKRIAKKGIKIEIITRNNGQENIKYPKNLKIVKLGTKSAPESNIARYFYLIKSFVHVYKNDFDLVHAHAFLPGITAKLLMFTKGVPVIFTVHGTSLGTSLNSLLSKFIENVILTKIKYTVQITVSRDFLKIKNVNKNVVYIPNAVDTKVFHKVKVKKFKAPTLICVGRLHPQKNLINLIKAFKKISNEYPSYTLLIVGDGPQKNDLEELIKKLRINGKIKLIGSVDKKALNGLYSSSSLFILPSIYEGQSLALLEAMACKLVPVVSRTGDNSFIVKEGINGFLIKNQGNPSNIAEAVEKALLSKNLTKIGTNGYNLARKSFSWDKSAEQTLKVYEKIT